MSDTSRELYDIDRFITVNLLPETKQFNLNCPSQLYKPKRRAGINPIDGVRSG